MKNNDVSNVFALGCLAALGYLIFTGAGSRSPQSATRLPRRLRKNCHLRLVSSNGKVISGLALVSNLSN